MSGIISFIIQAAILALILMKNRYAKLSIIIFCFLFFILGSGLQLIGRLFQDVGYGFENIDLFFYLKNIVLVTLGVFTVILANRTMKIERT